MPVANVRLRLLIAYDGRPFSGWQSQAGKDAVQDFLEIAFQKLVGRRVVVHGSGRTDAGVHALGQVAHADIGSHPIAPVQWRAALNAHLPPQIRVLKSTRASASFHARFNARGKIYTYRIWNSPFLHPLEIGRAWHMPVALDRAVLRQGAKLLLGTHDFAGFAANRGRPGEDTVRTIHSIRISASGPLITLRFEGSGFLYRMVRLLTGTLVRCAQGRDSLQFIQALLDSPRAAKTHYCAPAEGLYLTQVLYAAPGKMSRDKNSG